MRVLLDQDDIQTALNTYVEGMGLAGATGVELSIDGDDIVAEVMMGGAEPKAAKPKRKAPAKRRTTKAKAEEVTDEPTETAGEGSDDSADTAETERTEADAPAGEEAPKEAGTKKGNLFGDEETQSSESAETTTTDGAAEEKAPEDPPVKKTKKSSIFDVD